MGEINANEEAAHAEEPSWAEAGERGERAIEEYLRALASPENVRVWVRSQLVGQLNQLINERAGLQQRINASPSGEHLHWLLRSVDVNEARQAALVRLVGMVEAL